MIYSNGLQFRRVSLALALGVATALPAGARAQETTRVASGAPVASAGAAAEDNYAFEVGRAVVDRGNGTSSTYTITATQDYRAKATGAKIRLTVVEKAPGGTQTHLLTLNTGKYKTVAQLTQLLAEIFRKYLDAAPANQEVGKIGDLGHGGEVRFFAESPESLRYEWETSGSPAQSIHLKRTDIQVFLGLLTHPKAGA